MVVMFKSKEKITAFNLLLEEKYHEYDEYCLGKKFDRSFYVVTSRYLSAEYKRVQLVHLLGTFEFSNKEKVSMVRARLNSRYVVHIDDLPFVEDNSVTFNDKMLKKIFNQDNYSKYLRHIAVSNKILRTHMIVCAIRHHDKYLIDYLYSSGLVFDVKIKIRECMKNHRGDRSFRCEVNKYMAEKYFYDILE